MTKETLDVIESQTRDYGWDSISPGETLMLVAEVRRLQEALRDYGQHEPRCERAGHCTCGLDDALAGSDRGDS